MASKALGLLFGFLVTSTAVGLPEFCRVDERMLFTVASDVGRLINHAFKECIPKIMKGMTFRPSTENITRLIGMSCETIGDCWRKHGDVVDKAYDCVDHLFPERLRKINISETDIQVMREAAACMKPKMRTVEATRYALAYGHKITG